MEIMIEKIWIYDFSPSFASFWIWLSSQKIFSWTDIITQLLSNTFEASQRLSANDDFCLKRLLQNPIESSEKLCNIMFMRQSEHLRISIICLWLEVILLIKRHSFRSFLFIQFYWELKSVKLNYKIIVGDWFCSWRRQWWKR